MGTVVQTRRLAGAVAVGVFEEHVATRPDAVAVRHHESAYSYADLDRWSAAVAVELADAGVGRGDLVALSTERSPAMIASVLAVLRLGAGYVALDPQVPERWRADLLARVEPRCLLECPGGADVSTVDTMRIEVAATPPATSPVDVPCTPAGDDTVFQLAPTSGTTGQPRLVRISYRAVLNRLEWMWRDYPFPDGAVVAVQKFPALVASPWEMLGGLLRGVPSVVLDHVEVIDPRLLASVIAEEGISHLYLTPHVIAGLVAEAERVGGIQHRMRLVTSGADALPPAVALGFRRAFPGVTLLNLYGMTETSSNIAAFDTAALADTVSRVPVGRPVAGARISVHDAHGRLVPVGVTGDIRVSGVPVALGYHGDAARTAERFTTRADGTMVFHTGDRGRWLPEGSLEVSGRADNQVKIRGYRVELEEVEAVLATAPGVTATGVCVLDETDPVLVGCVLADAELDLAELRGHLYERLPEYLVPARLLRVDTLPRGTNGKVDRTALRRLAEHTTDVEPTTVYQPADAWEQTVAECWAELVGQQPRDATESFFEAGGHSLLSIRLIAALEERSGHRIDLRSVFAAPSVPGIAAALRAQKEQGGDG